MNGHLLGGIIGYILKLSLDSQIEKEKNEMNLVNVP